MKIGLVIVCVTGMAFTSNACRTNVFQPMSEISANEKDEKLVSRSILEAKFKEAAARLRKMLEDKHLSPEKRAKYEKLLASALLSDMGMTLEKIMQLDTGTEQEKFKKSLEMAPMPSQENLSKLDEAIKSFEKNPEPSPLDLEYLQAARSMKSAAILKKATDPVGKFDRKIANQNLADEDADEILKLMKDSELSYIKSGNEKKAAMYRKNLDKIEHQRGSNLKEKILNYVEELSRDSTG